MGAEFYFRFKILRHILAQHNRLSVQPRPFPAHDTVLAAFVMTMSGHAQ